MQTDFLMRSAATIALVTLWISASGCGGGNSLADAGTDGATMDGATMDGAVPSYSVGCTVIGLVGSLVLQNNGGDDLSVTQDGSFSFATPIADRASYDVTVLRAPGSQRCTVASGSGMVSGGLVDNVTVSCTDKLWASPATNADYVPFAASPTDAPKTAMDAAGNTLVVWGQADGSTACGGGSCVRVFMSEYRAGGWTHPSSAADAISPSGSDASQWAVAMGGLGDAIVVWQQPDGSGDAQIFASEYRSGSWAHPSGLADHITPAGNVAQAPKVAMDDSGNAIISWKSYDSDATCGAGCAQIFVARYSGGSWSYPADQADNLSPDGSNVFGPATVAMADNGAALLAWIQADASSDCAGSLPCAQVFLSEHASGWTNPVDRSDNISPQGSNAIASHWGMDKSGDALIAWTQYDGTTSCSIVTGCSQVFLSERRSGSWTHPASLSAPLFKASSHANDPRVAMSDSGQAVVAWRQKDATVTDQVFVSEVRGGAWTHPSGLSDNISPDTQNVFGAPEVGIDRDGNTLVIWRQASGAAAQVFRAEYRGGSWTLPGTLADYLSFDTAPCNHVGAAVSDGGDAVIVWSQQVSGTYRLFLREYR